MINNALLFRVARIPTGFQKLHFLYYESSYEKIALHIFDSLLHAQLLSF